jgi:broad specificity phosphatase PhoE
MAVMKRAGRWLIGSLIACALIACAHPAAAETPLTVFLVRHGEKLPSGDDPSLSEAGRHRAETLAATLADAGIGAIFVSEYKRTKETAEPLGKQLGIEITVVPGNDIDGLVAKLRALGSGKRALVVGHSNTIPAIATRLTGVAVGALTDSDYDRLFIVHSLRDGEGDIVTLHVGQRP